MRGGGNSQRTEQLRDKEQWLRQTRTFNGKTLHFRTSNITHFEEIVPSLEQESKHGDLGWLKHPDKQHWTGFSSSPSSNGIADGDSEDIIAENIFDWWISGKSYTKWYAEKFLQLKLFNDNEETKTIH